jgi:hypothetical protein
MSNEEVQPPKEEPDFNRLEDEFGLSPLDQDALQMHELFNSLVRAGFKDKQAIRLVALIISENDVLDEGVIVHSSDFEFIDDEDEEDEGPSDLEDYGDQ